MSKRVVFLLEVVMVYQSSEEKEVSLIGLVSKRRATITEIRVKRKAFHIPEIKAFSIKKSIPNLLFPFILKKNDSPGLKNPLRKPRKTPPEAARRSLF